MGKRTNTAVWMEKQQRWQIKVQKNGELFDPAQIFPDLKELG